MTGSPAGITIACVYNDLAVREDCLDRSLAAFADGLPVEYLPIDNREQTFTSAGAALNHAARRATYDVLVLCHQDVYLHAYEPLAEAARLLRGGTWGLLGANGFTDTGASVGRLRDRLLLLGRSSTSPTPVDSLDEVLFMATRAQLLTDPLTEDPDLAWHAYGVEYGVRVRHRGLRVGALDLAITHNSLTINLARLTEAHQQVARLHPAAVPLHTTCGVVGGPNSRRRLRDLPVLRNLKWRWTWLKESRTAMDLQRRFPAPAVLSDIRSEIDRLPSLAEDRLVVLNLDPVRAFAGPDGAPLALRRKGRRIEFRSVTGIDEVATELAVRPESQTVLVADLSADDLDRLAMTAVTSQPCLIGVHGASVWLLVGPDARRPPEHWSRARSRPLSYPWSRGSTL